MFSIIKFIFFAVLMAVVGCTRQSPWPQSAPNENAPLVPDIRDITIPPNIAPLHFKIMRPAHKYRAVFTSDKNPSLIIESVAASISIPPKKWREMLCRNAGGPVVLTLSMQEKDGVFHCFFPCTVHVAREPIDPYLTYRIIKPIYNWWKDIAIYSRDLGTFEQREIICGERFENGCVNCHSFCNNDPQRCIVGVRSRKFGNTGIIIASDKAYKQNTKFGYSSWHPNGNIIAFSTMRVHQFFHSSRSEIRDVVDSSSSIDCYDIDRHRALTIQALVNPHELQTYPSWSPDGATMYFCIAPALWDSGKTDPPEKVFKVKYSLKKISYNAASDTWGKPLMVVSSEVTGKSILMPRVSPDGRFLLFCMCDEGVFPSFQKSSDLYCMDLAKGDYRKLDCNSNESESWHAWSSNSRWIAFSSKRADGVFTRIYLCYVDSSGKSAKPFVLPQKDPGFYGSFMKTYSVPEFITGRINVSPGEISRAIRSIPAGVDGTTAATMKNNPMAVEPHE